MFIPFTCGIISVQMVVLPTWQHLVKIWWRYFNTESAVLWNDLAAMSNNILSMLMVTKSYTAVPKYPVNGKYAKAYTVLLYHAVLMFWIRNSAEEHTLSISRPSSLLQMLKWNVTWNLWGTVRYYTMSFTCLCIALHPCHASVILYTFFPNCHRLRQNMECMEPPDGKLPRLHQSLWLT